MKEIDELFPSCFRQREQQRGPECEVKPHGTGRFHNFVGFASRSVPSFFRRTQGFLPPVVHHNSIDTKSSIVPSSPSCARALSTTAAAPDTTSISQPGYTHLYPCPTYRCHFRVVRPLSGDESSCSFLRGQGAIQQHPDIRGYL
jgi:hypothetical protein